MARRESVFDMVSGMVAKDLEPLKRHLIKKARREWAEQIVEKARLHYNDGEPSPFINVDQARQLLRKEHARAVRVVKQAKALQLHGLRDTDTNEFLEGYEAACVDILSAITKGRA